MPYQISTFHLPGGTRCVRTVGAGYITKEDVDYLMDHIGPGRPLYGLPMVVLAQQMEGMAADARRVFVSSGEQHGSDHPWFAVVVSNPVIRVAINFMMRISGASKLKMFPSEPEALQWLDERIREDAAKAAEA